MTTTARSTPARVLIAADKFKGSLTAVEVADRVSAGIRKARPEARIEAVPVADGGDGTVAAAVAGGFTRHEVEVTGPTGAPVTAAFALREGTAVVEMAEAAGLQHLPRGVFVPLTATTYGVGELLLAALDAGAHTVILGVGGSATTDGGAGMLDALGARLLDRDGDTVPWGGGGLRELVTADLSGLDERLGKTEFVLASDVDNPLTGPKGAAAVYGPQKGASDADVTLLDDALTHLAEVLGAQEAAASPGAGAAGGIGFAALVGLRARFRPGIEIMMEELGVEAAIGRASLVITGEGSLDEQTLHGKAPAGVAAAARRAGKPVVAVCGRLAIDAARLKAAGIERAYALTDIESDVERCIAEAGPLLEALAERLAADRL
ncbi:glycerate kinase [Streptomyces albus]|uniref:glycerate kinase n=1 Tax=Streptomyces TaxID=1883 RepID=UPI00034E35F4|nr:MULTISPECIES: glycerate kinase [Streptomyces]EPD93288.1 glycerate kinase [Streptomyces sp. HPH0547]KPC90723.1 glycerate kinase [Streptomyces sp. NRRL F-6602]MDI6408730.1 glycerate kinase [Streptomyces albus]